MLKKISSTILIVLLAVLNSTARNNPGFADSFKIGWASADITPPQPVLIAGQFHARVSEGIMDPITATALAIESVKDGKTAKVIMISCDFVSVSDGMRDESNLRDQVRKLLSDLSPALAPEDIMINATHTHAAPLLSVNKVESIYGVGLKEMSPGTEVMTPEAYSGFAAVKIADAARKAWVGRKKGGISFGLSKAVIGHNRLQVDENGKSLMYGNVARPQFSHIEGYENHDLNLLYTWDANSQLTGVVVNAPVPSQVSEHSYLISADFWNETRISMRERLGKNVHILAQASSAGDQSPHLMWGSKAEERMQKIMGLVGPDGTGRGKLAQRKQIALRITDAVVSILPYMKKTIEWNPPFAHKTEVIPLSRRLLGESDLKDAEKEITQWQREYDQMLQKIKANPEKTREARWYTDITICYSKLRRGQSVLERYELEKKQPKMPVEIHVLRIGDAAFASNPFELYLDYGIQMIARSPAIQTFIVQLTGSGTYLPTKRSIAGGAYGAVPASTLMGPEGGKELVEKTLDIINSLW
jgi:hypothetical protein